MNSRSSSDALPSRGNKGRKHRQSDDARNRSRASLACLNCRQRKIKCDVQSLPPGTSCTACRHSNNSCLVNQFSDRRRHGSHEHIESLQDRIRFLETLVQQNPASQQMLQEITHIDDSASHNSLESMNQLRAADNATARPSTELGRTQELPMPLPDSSSGAASAFGRQQTVEDPDPEIHVIQQPSPPATITTSTGHRPFQMASRDELRPETQNRGGPSDVPPSPQDRSVRQLALMETTLSEPHATLARHSSIPGRPQNGEHDTSTGGSVYYGPACSLHVSSSPSQVIRMTTLECQRPKVNLDMDSSKLKSVLIKSYCDFQRLSVALVHQETFLSHREVGLRSQHYSTFLENAMLACSARLSTSVTVRSLGVSYAERARSAISVELEDPNMATMQGLLLLSDYEMTECRDRVGWIYCGIACRLIFDLGLHEELHCDNRQHAESHQNLTLRGSLAIGCLIYESLWSLYLGRPSTMSLLSISLTPLAANASNNILLKAWFELCVPMSEITSIINSRAPIADLTLKRLSQLDQHLRDWYAALPTELTLDKSDIASLDSIAYGLHMQYLRVQMLLHSLSSAKSKKRKPDPNESQPTVLQGWTLESSYQLLHDSSIEMINLGTTYQQIYGLENTPSVMLDNLYVAATCLISQILRSHPAMVTETDLYWLRLLNEMLDALKVHFAICSRMRRTLALLAEGCAILSDIFASDFPMSPERNLDVGHPSTSKGGWASFEAVMNDFTFGWDLVGMPDLSVP